MRHNVTYPFAELQTWLTFARGARETQKFGTTLLSARDSARDSAYTRCKSPTATLTGWFRSATIKPVRVERIVYVRHGRNHEEPPEGGAKRKARRRRERPQIRVCK